MGADIPTMFCFPTLSKFLEVSFAKLILFNLFDSTFAFGFDAQFGLHMQRHLLFRSVVCCKVDADSRPDNIAQAAISLFLISNIVSFNDLVSRSI